MTDNERELLRERFLEPETRCDFFVDANRKKLWKSMLDMLEILDRTCREHGLRYFLFYGSLLGAIRHKGFIPWDDDLDIVMPRPDFDRIQTILEAELPSPYFLQNFKTDPGFAQTFFKIRNSATSAITPFWTDHHIVANLGIFIDIHSIDGMPKSPRTLRVMQLFRNLLVAAQIRKAGWKGPFLGWKRRMAGDVVACLLGRGGVHAAFSRLARLNSFGTTEQCAITPAYYGYSPPMHVFPTDWFNDVEIVDFEYLQAPVPKCSDDILTSEYGDWHQFVRGADGGARHNWMRYDTERDYKTVLIEEFGYKPEDFDK